MFLFYQGTGPSHLKVSLLQGSFVLDIWNKIGKQAYVETVHPFVVSNLLGTPCKSSAIAASVLLIGSSEELGVPVTVHQVVVNQSSPPHPLYPFDRWKYLDFFLNFLKRLFSCMTNSLFLTRRSYLSFTALARGSVMMALMS